MNSNSVDESGPVSSQEAASKPECDADIGNKSDNEEVPPGDEKPADLQHDADISNKSDNEEVPPGDEKPAYLQDDADISKKSDNEEVINEHPLLPPGDEPSGLASKPADDADISNKSDNEEVVNENPLLPPGDEPSGLIDADGEINWDCPCLQGMADGPCGAEFKDAFSCFHHSDIDPKGADCIGTFRAMQECFIKFPEIYGSLDDDDDLDEEGNDMEDKSTDINEADNPENCEIESKDNSNAEVAVDISTDDTRDSEGNEEVGDCGTVDSVHHSNENENVEMPNS